MLFELVGNLFRASVTIEKTTIYQLLYCIYLFVCTKKLLIDFLKMSQMVLV